MICEFCQALAGRINAFLECCQIRQLAEAPAHVRKAAYERTRKEGGEQALAELKQKVRTEYQRQQEHKQARARLELEAQTAKNRSKVGALIKTMKESNMHLSPAERVNAKECA